MKKFLMVAVVVLTALLVSAVVLPMSLRGRIEEKIRREAGARLDVCLDFRKLDISLLRRFPYASLDLKDLVLTGTGRFEGDTLVSAGRISVIVGVRSLFGDGGFEVTQLKLVRCAVYAHKLADGTQNWDVVKPSGGPRTKGENPPSFCFSLRDVRMSDAALRYQDDSTDMHFFASPVSLRLKGDLSASRTDLALRLKVVGIRWISGNITLVSDADAMLDATIEADLVNRRFIFLQNTLRLNTIPLSLIGRVDLSDPGAVAVDIRADCSRVQFKDILSMVPAFYSCDFNNLTASGDLSLSAWVKGEVRGSLLPAFELKLGVRNGQFQYTSLPKAVTDIQLTARVASPGGTFDRVVLEVPDFSLMMAGNPLKASFSASHALSDLHFDASASGRLDLESIRKVYPLAGDAGPNGRITADLHVAGRQSDIDSQRYEAIEASGAFVVERMTARLDGLPEVLVHRAAATISSAAMTLGELNVTMGRSDLTANGQLTGYIGYLLDGMPLSGRLYMHSELLDLNELMAATPSSEASGAADTTDTAALTVPRNLNFSLSADLRKILLRKMTISDFTGELRTKGGTAALERMSMKAFGGSMLASGSYSTAVDTQSPDLTLALDIAHASFARTFEELELIRHLTPLFQKTGGDYSMTLDMTTRLDAAMSPDLRTLDARGEIRSANVHIRDVGVFVKMAEMLRNDKLRTIDAKDVKIHFSVADGCVSTQPFELRMGPVSVNLSGTTGLDQRIDYAARVTLPEVVTGGPRPSIDVRIGGTFSAPKVTLGVQEIVRQAVTNLLHGQPRNQTSDRQ